MRGTPSVREDATWRQLAAVLGEVEAEVDRGLDRDEDRDRGGWCAGEHHRECPEDDRDVERDQALVGGEHQCGSSGAPVLAAVQEIPPERQAVADRQTDRGEHDRAEVERHPVVRHEAEERGQRQHEDPVHEPEDDEDVPDAPAEEQHPDERDEVRDDERHDSPDRGAEAIPGDDPIHAGMLTARRPAVATPEVSPGRRRRSYASPGVRCCLAPETVTVFSSAPRTMTTSNGSFSVPRASCRSSASAMARPPADTIRSPTAMPAAAAALPSSTPRTRMPSRSGRPT